jgi:hypothetical protein
MIPRTTITQALQTLAGNACTGNCNQGRACTCGNRTPWATTSDPLAWVKVDTPATPVAPQNARRIPRASPPWRLRDWLIAAVVVASVLCAQALADMPTSVLMKGWT